MSKLTLLLDIDKDGRKLTVADVNHELNQVWADMKITMDGGVIEFMRVREFRRHTQQSSRGKIAPHYGWIITADWDCDPEDGVPNHQGLTGPHDIPLRVTERLWKGEGKPFQMLTDDGDLIYEGRIIIEDSAQGTYEEPDEFAPLNDFGTGDAGCTEIRYHNGNTWEVL